MTADRGENPNPGPVQPVHHGNDDSAARDQGIHFEEFNYNGQQLGNNQHHVNMPGNNMPGNNEEFNYDF